jgi:hypothetical protein
MVAPRRSISKIISVFLLVLTLSTPAIAYRTYADFRRTVDGPHLSDFFRSYAEGIDHELYGVTIWFYVLGFSAILGISVFAALSVNAPLWVAAHPWLSITTASSAPILMLPVTVIAMNLSWICALYFFGAVIGCGSFLALHRNFPEATSFRSAFDD